jgi:hypothetical protein
MGDTNGSTALARSEPKDMAIMERVLIVGDLKQLQPTERVSYYSAVCRSVGLNPLTSPFEYLVLNGKMTLYAKKNATDQLREIHHVSVDRLESQTIDGVHVVTAHASKAGRKDSDIGAVNIANLKGEALANALMKATTKAKRRVTLSICGLSFLDESELETVKDARPMKVNLETGEILESGPLPEAPKSEPKVEEAPTNTKTFRYFAAQIRKAKCGDDLGQVAAEIKQAFEGGKLTKKQREELKTIYAKQLDVLTNSDGAPPDDDGRAEYDAAGEREGDGLAD